MIRGIVRHTDNLGRIVVPREYYKTLGISPGDQLDITVHGDEIRIRKLQANCALCGTAENLQLHFTDKLVCTNCLGGGRK